MSLTLNGGVDGLRRSNIEICADLIGAAEGGARKTQMVYRANLNFCVIRSYLALLIERGLLSERPPFFYPTEKGRSFMILIDKVKACLG